MSDGQRWLCRVYLKSLGEWRDIVLPQEEASSVGTWFDMESGSKAHMTGWTTDGVSAEMFVRGDDVALLVFEAWTGPDTGE